MTDFLLELRSEEIPARMQDKACADLARLFEGEIAKAGLKAVAIETYATPRRLALIARGLPEATEAVREETKGPRAGAPPQALEGFLRKTGLTADQLTERDGVLFAIVEKPGRATAAVLAEAVPAVIRTFPWPKSMRWGAASASTAALRWVRPLQGIVALFGEDVVPFEIEGIAAGAATVGHRFHHPGPITIGSAADYAEKLRLCHVILDARERRGIIEGAARALAQARGLHLVADEGLVAENAGLTEWPVPLLGDFDPAFLEVPREVIQLTLRTNQKYFVLADGEGRLAPNFICTANIEAEDGGAAIVAGNRKVLAARLSDARFFWEQDLRVPLEAQAEKLGQIVFHEKLGTVADKVERVAKLARWLVEEGIISSPARGGGPSRSDGGGGSPLDEAPAGRPLHHQPAAGGPPPRTGEECAHLADLAEQAARLCKADLVTGMVGEFPELQGVMGGYYARAQGLDPQVADAIRDHYKPVGQGDDVPTAPVTVAVSLADKLDTLTGFFGIESGPSGSKDPFALRRAGLGVIGLILRNSLRFDLQAVIVVALTFHGVGWWRKLVQVAQRIDDKSREIWSIFENSVNAGQPLSLVADTSNIAETLRRRLPESEETDAAFAFAMMRRQSVVNFFGERLMVQQRESGVRPDIVSAVFAQAGEGDLVRLLARVKALQAFVATPDGANLLAGYKRAANILKKESFEAAGEKTLSYTPENAEALLIAALDSAEERVEQAVAAERFEEAMAALATLRAPIDAFFEGVTVNDADPTRRTGRLGLLARIRAACHSVADFSKIEG